MNMLDRAIDAAKRNPEGALLLAAGCALLMRGVNAAAGRIRTGYDHQDRSSFGMDDEAGADGSGAHGLMQSARAYASEMGGKVAHTAEAAAGLAADARRAAVARTGEAARGVRSGTSDAVGRMLDEQPLAVGLIGVAAGVLIAAALPGSKMERRAFAPVGRQLGETAQEARRRLKRAAERTRDRAVEMAEEHGLTRQGLKDAMTDVAETFSDEVMAPAKPARNGRQKAAAAAATTGKTGRATSSAKKRTAKAAVAKAAKLEEKAAAPAASSDMAATKTAGGE